MENPVERNVLRELAFRLAALEDNVSFLEMWCEEQQDALDRLGELPWWFHDEIETSRPALYVVDLTEEEGEESEHQRRVRQIRARIDRLRHGLAAHDALPPRDGG